MNIWLNSWDLFIYGGANFLAKQKNKRFNEIVIYDDILKGHRVLNLDFDSVSLLFSLLDKPPTMKVCG